MKQRIPFNEFWQVSIKENNGGKQRFLPAMSQELAGEIASRLRPFLCEYAVRLFRNVESSTGTDKNGFPNDYECETSGIAFI